MAVEYALPKVADSRGWSLMDIYHQARKAVGEQNPGTPYDKVIDPAKFQINYSVLNPGTVKAWHRHKNQDDYFCVIKGMAQVGVVTDNYPQDGLFVAEKFFIGEHNPAVVHIKAGEWHGLTAIGTEPVGLLYLVTNEYNAVSPDEERCPHYNFVGNIWWLPPNV